MAANLAIKAFQGALPAATDRLAKANPDMIAKAKDLLARATGIPVGKVNVGAIARADNGMNTQLVAEAMIRAGARARDLFQGLDVVGDAEMRRIYNQMVSLEASADEESNAHAMSIEGASGDVDPDTYATAVYNNKRIQEVCKVLGIKDVERLWDVKVLLDHLTKSKIQNFKTGGLSL